MRRSLAPRGPTARLFAAVLMSAAAGGCGTLPRLLLGPHPERLLLSALVEEQVPAPAAPPTPTRTRRRPTRSPTRSPSPAPTECPPTASPASAPSSAPTTLDAGSGAATTPAPVAITPSPIDTPPGPVELAPTEAAPPPSPTFFAVLDTASEPESMLKRLAPGTPPSVVVALHMIEDGREKMRQGRYDVALDRFERAVSLDPVNPYAYYFLARLHAETGKPDQAVAFAGRAVALSATVDKACLSRAYTLEAIVLEKVGRYADARIAFDKAVKADARNLEARLGKARLNGEQE